MNSGLEDRSDRASFSETFLFIVSAARPRNLLLFNAGDSLGLAMAVFVCEAGMHLDWCPNAMEGAGKRAAHTYFSYLRKSVSLCSPGQLATVAGYIWAAWLLAQKTEGIRDAPTGPEKGIDTCSYTFPCSEGSAKCDVFHFPGPPGHVCIEHGISIAPRIFRTIGCETRTGLSIYCSGELLTPGDVVEVTPVRRPHSRGIRFTYLCTLSSGVRIRWLTAVQVFRTTIYRSDLFRCENGSCTVSRATLGIESQLTLVPVSSGVWLGCGAENIAVELSENPCGLSHEGETDRQVSLFTGGTPAAIERTGPLRMTVAWRYGRGVREIERTNLQGFYDI
jgi:hypothetical protein